MRNALSLAVAAALLALAGCGDEDPSPADDDTHSGITGLVSLGPQCPVEEEANPCANEPAAGAKVTVSEQIPGEAYGAGPVVATAVTGDDGRFRVAVEPGDYVVTSDAGMSCEYMDAHVTIEAYTEVEVPCDTGIR